jgi:hypothetical protein
MGAMRRAGIVLLVVVLALGLGAAAADGKKKHKKKARKWGSSVTLTHPSDSQFTGVVGSKLDACRDSRLIGLYYTDPITLQTQPLSVQRTDGRGHYEVDLPSPAYPGNYQVQLIEERIKAMHAPQICKGAQSNVVTV